MFTKALFLTAVATACVAQDLGVPLSWREFSTNSTRAQRVTIAQDAINLMNGQLDTSSGQYNGIGFWQSANALSAMANIDYINGNTVNQDTVVNSLTTVYNTYANYDEYRWWATAAYYAYRAYGDTTLLSNAEDVWNHVSQFQITAADASAGSIPGKDFTIEGSCDGQTMAGGVFWRPTTDDTSVNSITTGLFLTLSAYLASATGNSAYTNAAIAAATWIQNLNLNSEPVVLDTVDAQDCSRSPSTWLFTYNSGKYIEGLSVLANVTGDTQWAQLYLDIANAAMKTTDWEGSNGVITEGADNSANGDGIGFKAVFIRGLHEAYQRSHNSAFQILIHSYLDVQFNALQELAQNDGSYSASWAGPAPSGFTSWGQLAALDPLVSAIDTNSP